jgi:hypothetical protein
MVGASFRHQRRGPDAKVPFHSGWRLHPPSSGARELRGWHIYLGLGLTLIAALYGFMR